MAMGARIAPPDSLVTFVQAQPTPPGRGGGGLDDPVYQMAEPATDLPLTDPFGQDALFLLDTYYKDVPELFMSYYPGARFEVVEGPGGQPLYLSPQPCDPFNRVMIGDRYSLQPP